MKSVFVLLLPVLSAFLLIGCTKDSNPLNSGSNITTNDPPGIGFILDGTSVATIDYPVGTNAYAEYYSNPGSGVPKDSRILTIELNTKNIHVANIFLVTVIPIPTLASFQIKKWVHPILADAEAEFWGDSLSYASDTGKVIITKFDTIANIVSGTFTFSAKAFRDSTKTHNITSGYFSNIPIIQGGFGHQLITANIDGYYFTSNIGFMVYPIWAYVNKDTGVPQLHITATGGDTSNTKQLSFILNAPKVGNFDLATQTSPTTAIASYIQHSLTNETISSTSGATGTITITKCDTIAHRISGTFNFSGKDASSGKTITISNGILDNVQWFDF